MDSSNVLALLEQLDDEIDDLEESLAPLLKTALSETASKLPLLDKAKLYVLVTYAIESMLFSYLRLNGVKAREHPVFKELTRVKQYFDKIKAAETPAAERNLKVDRKAAARFIKASLAGNDKYDLERAEREAKERARAHIKFEEASKQIEKKRKADKVEENQADLDSDSLDSDSSSESSEDVEKAPVAPVIPKKKRKMDKSWTHSDSAPTSGTSTPPPKSSKKGEKRREKPSKRDKRMAKFEKEGGAQS